MVMFTRNILKTDFAMIAGLVMFVATSFAGDFRVTADAGDVARVERVGPPTQYMPHLDRYSEQVPDAYHYPIPQEKITRETYLKWIEDSGHLSYAEGDAPTKHGQYGPRHFTPVLAKYVQTKDPKLADAMIRMLKAYDQWIRDEVKRSGWHSQFIDEPAYLGLYRKYLSEGGALDLQKDQWFRDLILYHTKTLHVWGTPQTYWRGPMHRAQGEGIAKGLAALWYPDAPDAAEWKKYADAVYQDWWKYKDVPPNDTGYIFGIFVPLFVGAYLRGDDTFFTDPEARKVWDRMLYEITPDGAIIPYGAHGGWNSTAGTRIFMLELLAAKTKDGRYRFGAHKLMNYLLYQQEPYKKHHILLGPETTEKIALAYLLADDSIQPVQPDAGSKILYRKETLRLRNKEAAEKWLGPLDPDPARNQICCSLIVTDKTVPAKLVLRSGWNPGDFFALVDIFPRHDPLNTPGILGMTRWGSVLGLAMNAKGSSEEGRLIVEDLGGTAPLRRNTDPDLADPYYQDVKIDAFVDMKKATFATVTVKDYAGFPVTYTRSFAFIKNRFLVARDVARFEEGFLARIASAYNSQNIGPQVGDHWANTYFSGPRSSTQTVKNPPYDLLVYFSPNLSGR